MMRSQSLAAFLAVAAGTIVGYGCSAGAAAPRPNVLVIVLDTLRADHLGVDGYERATSPNLDRFARENLRFPRAFAAAPWTPPSIATLFSGLYPTSHAMVPLDKPPWSGDLSIRFDESVPTLAEALRGVGYRTAAVSSNPWITPEFGFAQGFETFDVKVDARAEKITDLGLARIDELRRGGGPFFLYLHYLDPHDPYAPPDDHLLFAGQPVGRNYSAPMVEAIDRYDGEIHYLDKSLGRLFTELRARHLYDGLVIVLVGDHGEQFEEHGHTGHGWQLYNEELRVPLVLKTVGAQQGRSIERVASIVDMMPTILALAGLETRKTLQGVNLLDDEALEARRGVFCEITRQLSLRGYVNAKGMKIVEEHPFEGEPAESATPRRIVGVFDAFSKDESRVEDADLQRELEAELRWMLDFVARGRITPTSGKATPSEETIQKLRALGYTK